MMDNMNPFIVGAGDPTKPVAILFLYTPRIYGTQVLRPYVYQFTNEAVDSLLNGGPTMSDAFKRQDIASKEEVAGCIRPHPTGINLNMDVASTMWTFLLFIRTPNNYNGAAMQAQGVNTAIMTGQCLDEPVGPMGSINENCKLMVHSRQVMNSGSIINAYGARPKTRILASDDIIDPSMSMAADNHELYLTTPFTVMEYFDDGDVRMSQEAQCALPALDRNPVPVALKTPGVHMSKILHGLDIQNKEAQTAEFSPDGLSGLDTLSPADDIDHYKEGFTNRMSQLSVGNPVQSNGVDVTNLFSIGELDRMYNGGLKIKVQHVSETAQYDVIPQDLQNPKVAYSSFIASSIIGLAMDTGLSSISFMYTSNDPLKSSSMSSELMPSTFQVAPDDTFLASPPNDPTMMRQVLVSAVETFKMLFEKNVAMFIVPVVGDFTVAVRYSNTGECQVNLQLENFDMNTNLSADAWIEAPMRMGSVTTTSVGNIDTFRGNGHVLSQLLLLTQGKTQFGALNKPAFPMIDQEQPDVPDYSTGEQPAAVDAAPQYAAADLSF